MFRMANIHLHFFFFHILEKVSEIIIFVEQLLYIQGGRGRGVPNHELFFTSQSTYTFLHHFTNSFFFIFHCQTSSQCETSHKTKTSKIMQITRHTGLAIHRSRSDLSFLHIARFFSLKSRFTRVGHLPPCT